MMRTPKQKRSIEKKQRIKAAAFELMAQKGYHNTSSNEIAQKADVSIGTFYSYFKDKKQLYEELVGDVYAYVLDASATGIADIPKGLSPKEVAELLISSALKGHYYKREFQKEMAALSCQSEEFRQIEDQYKKHIPDFIRGIVSAAGLDLRISDVDLASSLVTTVVEGVIHETVFHGDGSEDERVVKELADLLIRYLFA